MSAIRPVLLWVTCLGLAGCLPGLAPVSMDGVVVEVESRALGLAGITVEVFETEEFTPIGSTESLGDGSFLIPELPASTPIFTVLSGPGHTTTSFSGSTGLTDFTVPAGAAAVFAEQTLDEILEIWGVEWAPDPETIRTGGMVLGQALLAANADQLPPLAEVEILFFDRDGNEFEAVYGDEDGLPSPSATETAPDGRFWAFGLQEGPYEVHAIYDPGLGTQRVAFQIYVPEDGVALLDRLALR